MKKNGEMDNPPWTRKDFHTARLIKDVYPEIVQTMAKERERRRGRPLAIETKTPVSLRLSSRVIDYFKAEGPGWQTRINKALLDIIDRT